MKSSANPASPAAYAVEVVASPVLGKVAGWPVWPVCPVCPDIRISAQAT
jgi:hypothetical protein